MDTTKYVRLGGLLLGGLVLIGPARSSRADEPATAVEADEMAQAAQQRADQYRELGGVAYKTGLVQRAEADATRYSSMAEEMSAPEVTVTSPEADHYAKLAEDYKRMGGVAYKTGLVQRAEADQRRAEEESVGTATTPAQTPHEWVDPSAPNCDDNPTWEQAPGCSMK